jgi:hypothetical protein
MTCPTIPYKTHKQKEEDNQQEVLYCIILQLQVEKSRVWNNSDDALQILPCDQRIL